MIEPLQAECQKTASTLRLKAKIHLMGMSLPLSRIVSIAGQTFRNPKTPTGADLVPYPSRHQTGLRLGLDGLRPQLSDPASTLGFPSAIENLECSGSYNMAIFVLQYVSHAVVSLPAPFILESLVGPKDDMKTLHHLRKNGILNPLITTSSLLAKHVTDPDPTPADDRHRSTQCRGKLP